MDIVDHLNNYFVNKVKKLRDKMNLADNTQSYFNIRNQIMAGKKFEFRFTPVTVSQVEKILLACKDKPAGVDNMDMKLLRLAANLISTIICHVFDLSLKKCSFPQAWKTAKIIPLPKNPTVSFCGSNSRPIRLLPVLSKIMEKIVFKQIQNYFAANDLNTDYQHAYREEHSTVTALTQMADEWLCEIDNRHQVGAVLLDFSAAFIIMDHKLLLRKLACYGFSPTATHWL